jgi:adenylosuccinate synthase
LDTLDRMDEINICVEYELDGRRISRFPSDAAKQRIETAIGKANAGIESAQEKLDQARDRLGLPERGPRNGGQRP